MVEPETGDCWDICIEAEFVATKAGTEALWRIQYKLWMMSIAVDGPMYVFMSVIHYTQKLESTLKKILDEILYHIFDDHDEKW